MATRKAAPKALVADEPTISASDADKIGAQLAAIEHLYAAAVRDVGRYGDELRELRAEFAAARE